MSDRWQRGFQAARIARQYAEAPTPGKKLGAALYAGSNLLSLGWNVYKKTHPQSVPALAKNLHAEHSAILRRQHYDNNRKLIMYVWRETGDGQVACSKPCDNCVWIMRESGIGEVRFYDEEVKECSIKL